MSITVPPPVPGDPAGVRALAAQLRSIAESVGADTAAVGGTIAAMVFTGPAATRLRGETSDASSSCSSTTGRLRDTADMLVRAASPVEAAQAERNRLLILAAHEAAEARRGSGL